MILLILMATAQDAHMVEQIIGYTFQTKRYLLLRALTAAGAVKEDWDGNRKLAQLGTVLTEFLLTYLAFEADAARDNTNAFRCSLSNIEQRAAVARRTGIDRCIKYSERGGVGSASVLAKAVNAIIGAVYLDCGENTTIVFGIMQRLGIFLQSDQTVDPTLLSHHEVADFPDVATFAKTVLRPRIDSFSASSLIEKAQLSIVPVHKPPIEAGSATQEEHAADVSIQESSQHEFGLSLHDDTSVNDIDLGVFFDYSCLGDVRSTNSDHECRQDWEDQEVWEARGESTKNAYKDREGHRRPAVKRRVPVDSGAMRKKKVSSSNEFQIQDHFLAAYLREEAARCQNHGCPPPEESFFTPAIKATIRDFCEAKADMLAKILVYIAGPYSIAALQEVLLKSSGQQTVPALHLRAKLSKTQRFNLIRTLDQNILHFQLLRRYHILELYKECGGPATQSDGGFVLTTQHNFAKARNKPGNPMNSAEAEVTTKMMEEIFPDIRPGSDEYQTKYRITTALRKLGHRLHVLEAMFGGRGILGLMLGHGLAGQLCVGISDNMILNLSDAVFKKLINLLEESQGDILREFSAAVSTIVDAVIAAPLQQREPFKLESLQLSDILQYPKGAPGLLSLIG